MTMNIFLSWSINFFFKSIILAKRYGQLKGH